MEITLDKLLDMLKRNIIFIIIVSVLFGALSFVMTKFLISPSYEAKVRMYVDSPASATTTQIDQVRKVTQTYIYFLDTVDFCQQILDNSDPSISATYSAEDLKSMVSYTIINNTEVFDVKIQGKDPDVLLKIADTVASLAPERVKQFDAGSNVGIVEKAIPANVNQPVSPNVRNNTAIGVILGILLAFGLVFLKDVIDVRIKSADDINSMYDYPIMGNIPVFYTSSKSRKSGVKYGR